MLPDEWLYILIGDSAIAAGIDIEPYEWVSYKILEIIEKYDLSQSSKFGYDYYSCNSNSGLAPYNKDKFLKLREDFIKLGQALKATGLVESGVEAKIVIQNGEVMVNGETEFQRGKKLYDKRDVAAEKDAKRNMERSFKERY